MKLCSNFEKLHNNGAQNYNLNRLTMNTPLLKFIM